MVHHEDQLYQVKPVRDEARLNVASTYLERLAEFLDALEIVFGYENGIPDMSKGQAKDNCRIAMRHADDFEMYNLKLWLEENFTTSTQKENPC